MVTEIIPGHKTTYSKSILLCSLCVCRKVRKEATAHRNAVSETAAMTAGTLRGVSLFLHHDTLVTTPLTGERHLSAHMHTRTQPKYVDTREKLNTSICFLINIPCVKLVTQCEGVMFFFSLFCTVWTLLAPAHSTVLLLMW